MTPTQEKTLALLRKERIMTARELADTEGVDQRTAYSRLKKLASLGVAKEVPSLAMENPGTGGGAFFWFEIAETTP